ncbi:MAG: 50S ribosomal protein L21 [Myxococcaceae bacterium]|nr:50S ribosomal protein L21 [Myxococcaceae bacterium]MBH2005778.1 50S ribosomal protein L21 [Myxococcaceae bacterium]
MTYAIIEAAGKQHRVSAGERLKLDLTRTYQAGDAVTFDKVLMIGGEAVKLGKPLVSNAKVQATVLSTGKDKKVLVFKKKRRQGYQKSQGHRQHFVEVLINEVHSGT